MTAEVTELREFQRLSCARACEALFDPADGSRRFLVADEVGLGKTRVAKGVIAEIRRRHQRARKGTVIVYVAANAEIGRQNGRVLRGGEAGEADLPGRPTLLPLYADKVRARGLHILTFTPMTALRLRRGTGTARERALLLQLVRRIWKCGEGDRVIEIFRVRSDARNFRSTLEDVKRLEIDKSMAREFRKAVRRDPSLTEAFRSLRRKHTTLDRNARNKLIGDLRALLARTALGTLKPGLVVLDEFQKFRWVVEEADERERLANQLLGDCPALLLSATPYRMRARAADDGLTDDDLLPLLRFLYRSVDRAAAARDALGELRWALEKLRGDESPEAAKSIERAREARREAQQLLVEVMCRWERPVGSSDATNVECASLEPADIRAYSAFQAAVDLAAAPARLTHRQTVEYWKSAPYLFNFMRGYKVKQALREARQEASLAREIFPALRRSRDAHLDWKRIHRYEDTGLPNGRTRELREAALADQQWRLLWVPPSACPYRFEGVYRGLGEAVTKQLVFSGWTVVPTSVSAIVGYEAERRAVSRGERNDKRARKRRSSKRLLDFRHSRGKGPTGTVILGLCFPSVTLARAGDPFALAAKCSSSPPSLSEVLSAAEKRLTQELREAGVPRSQRGRAGNQAWYWLAPLLLDQENGIGVRRLLDRELGRAWATRRGDRDTSVALEENLRRASAALDDPDDLGPPPRNLARVLAEMAVGGPGPAAVRSLGRALDVDPSSEDHDLLIPAGRIAWGVRGLLGRPDATLVIQHVTKRRRGVDHWRRTLRYCCDGGMSAMLDEYLHLVRDDADGDTPGELASRMADQVVDVAGLEPLLVRADDAAGEGTERSPFAQRTLSSRFAAPFGANMTEDSGSVHPDTVRRAFNSPFWPWALITTSVGQEGLDFHRYCHSIVHWNVPVSPVELEQREGRVRRFLSHGVRKNIAATHALQAVDARSPWDRMRELAAESAVQTDRMFAPEWVYGDDRVRATVLVPPFSRDAEHYERVRRKRVFYRLALGQPKPHELVEALEANLTPERAAELLPQLKLDLSPQPTSPPMNG